MPRSEGRISRHATRRLHARPVDSQATCVRLHDLPGEVALEFQRICELSIGIVSPGGGAFARLREVFARQTHTPTGGEIAGVVCEPADDFRPVLERGCRNSNGNERIPPVAGHLKIAFKAFFTVSLIRDATPARAAAAR